MKPKLEIEPDSPRKQEPKKQKERNSVMKTISKKGAAKLAGGLMILMLAGFGTIEVNRRINIGLDNFAMKRVSSSESLKNQFVKKVREEVILPVIDPGKTEEFKNTVKDAAKSGAVEGTDQAIEKNLKQ